MEFSQRLIPTHLGIVNGQQSRVVGLRSCQGKVLDFLGSTSSRDQFLGCESELTLESFDDLVLELDYAVNSN